MKGFTIIELTIVVAIIAIIASVAIPAYSAYAIRAKLSEGLTILRSAGNRMEIDLITTNAYLCDKSNWNSQYFSYECSASAGSFTITAYGLNEIADYSYSLSSGGGRKTLSHPLGSSNTCWRINEAC